MRTKKADSKENYHHMIVQIIIFFRPINTKYQSPRSLSLKNSFASMVSLFRIKFSSGFYIDRSILYVKKAFYFFPPILTNFLVFTQSFDCSEQRPVSNTDSLNDFIATN